MIKLGRWRPSFANASSSICTSGVSNRKTTDRGGAGCFCRRDAIAPTARTEAGWANGLLPPMTWLLAYRYLPYYYCSNVQYLVPYVRYRGRYYHVT